MDVIEWTAWPTHFGVVFSIGLFKLFRLCFAFERQLVDNSRRKRMRGSGARVDLVLRGVLFVSACIFTIGE